MIRAIPLGVQKRLSQISSYEEIFDKNIKPYQEALDMAGHTHILKFEPEVVINKPKPKCKPRLRNVCWYNPPYHMLAIKHIGKTFKEALNQCIPRGHPLYPVINEHTTKLSYSTMPNMAMKIGGQNNRVERDSYKKEGGRECDCPKTKGGNPFKCPWG